MILAPHDAVASWGCIIVTLATHRHQCEGERRGREEEGRRRSTHHFLQLQRWRGECLPLREEVRRREKRWFDELAKHDREMEAERDLRGGEGG